MDPALETFPGFRVTRELSSAPQAITFLAQDLESHQPCVIKQYQADSRLQQEHPALCEFRVLRSLRHPSLVRLLGCGRSEPTKKPFLIFNHVDGVPLFQAARRCSLPDLVTIFLHISHALDYCHRRGVIHADVSPANILITLDNSSGPSITLVDFSAAIRTTDQVREWVCLTPGYAAPEVIATHQPTIAGDLYALGAVIGTCLGDLGTSKATPDAPRREPLSDPLTRDLLALARTLLDPEPTKRPISAWHVATRLNAIAIRHGISETPVSYTPYLMSMPFCGRSGELSTLADSLTSVARAPASCTHVHQLHGPPGIGKSRLLQEVISMAYAQGYRICELCPSLNQYRITDSYAPNAPLLIIEDVNRSHNSQPPVPSNLDASRVVLVYTVLSNIPASESSLCAPSPDGTLVHRIHALVPLTSTDLSLSISAGLGLDSLGGFSEDLYRWSGGNPELSWALLNTTLHTGQVTIRDRALVSVAPPSLIDPRDGSAIITRLLDTLSGSERQIMSFLCIARFPVTFDVLHIAAQLDPPYVTTLCTRLAERGFLLLRASATITTAYACDAYSVTYLLTHSLPDRLSDTLTLSSALISGGTTPGEHLRAADLLDEVGDQDRAMELRIDAAQRCIAINSHDQAIPVLRIILSSPQLSPRRRLHLSSALIAALRRVGRLSDAYDVATSLQQNLLEPDEHVCHLLTLAELSCSLGQYRRGADFSRAAMTSARKHFLPAEHLSALVVLGESMCSMGRKRAGRRLLFKALRKARSSGALLSCVSALKNIAFTYWKEGRRARARWYEQRRLYLLRRYKHTRGVATALQNLGILRMEQGQYSRARSLFRETLRNISFNNAPTLKGPCLINIGETFRCEGRLRASVRATVRAIGYLSSSGETHRKVVGTSNLALLYTRGGYLGHCRDNLVHRLRDSSVREDRSLLCAVLEAWAGYLLAVGCPIQASRVTSLAIRLGYASGHKSSILSFKTLHAQALSAQGRFHDTYNVLRESLRRHKTRSPRDAVLLAKIDLHLVRSRLLPQDPRNVEGLEALIEICKHHGLWTHVCYAVIARAALEREDSDGDKSVRALLEVAENARLRSERMQAWQAEFWLGRHCERKLRNDQAYQRYRHSLLLVREIADGIDVHRHKRSFLAQPLVVELMARYERTKHYFGRIRSSRVTALQQSEKSSRQMLSSLSAIGQQLTSILELDKLLASILDLAIENVHAERGVIYLYDEVLGGMRPHSARGVAGSQLEHTPMSRSVMEEASQGKSIVTVDVGQDPQLSGVKSLIVQHVKSILCVPMKSRGRVVGVVYLDTQKATQLFGEKERAFIESFASQAAVAIENARLFGEIRAENSRLRREVQVRVDGLVGASPPMQRLAAMLSTLSNTDATILLTGESGTGKGVVARAIHSSSRRQEGPFVAVDCGALPDNLLEAEVFGYRRGAFTGADRDRVGLFEEADKGTLFLDEVANMSLALQKRLLRVLQEREIRRLGENEIRHIDVRIVAATNGDLKKLVAEGRFREDLFYRLNVVGLELPPLRERLEDLELLIERFLRDSAPAGSRPKRLAPGVLKALASHDWPGNVRELQNAIERLVAVAPGEIILPDHLPDHLRDKADSSQSDARTQPQGAPAEHPLFKTGEQRMIEEALRRFAGDKAKAARYIGWNRQKLYRRMRAYGVPARLGRKAA